MLLGIDVSNNNASVDLGAAHRAGAQFVAIKATQGAEFDDPTFGSRWREARALGMPRMAYHFFEPWEDGAAQADYLHSWVRSHGRFVWGDFVMLDLEWIRGPGGGEYLNDVISRAEAFCRRAYHQIAKQIVIYTSAGFWADVGNPSDTLLSKFPLFAAQWNGEPGSVQSFGGWPVVSFHQYSGSGTWPGVSGECDLDAFLGNRKQLDQLRYNLPRL